MRHPFGASLVLCGCLMSSMVAADKAMPRGPAPRFMVVTEISKEGITLQERIPGDKKADLYVEKTYEVEFADFQVLDTGGQPLTKETFRKRVDDEPIVLVFAEKVEPAYSKTVRAATAVIVVNPGKLRLTSESGLVEAKPVPEKP
jgi:hypothetical protein